MGAFLVLDPHFRVNTSDLRPAPRSGAGCQSSVDICRWRLDGCYGEAVDRRAERLSCSNRPYAISGPERQRTWHDRQLRTNAFHRDDWRISGIVAAHQILWPPYISSNQFCKRFRSPQAKTGSIVLISNTAADQLADLRKQRHEELFHLLTRVVSYLKSRNWETRIASAKAIGGIVSHAGKSDPDADDDVKPESNGHVKDDQYGTGSSIKAEIGAGLPVSSLPVLPLGIDTTL
ncbi:uncharacterized protein BDZ99DRAFT_518068 [Mytilinidion resinicola]|uniref:Uncharacterized protein n=1 Tax=Mytilinidion resinicola TaxID=574789 RepID=A0A6A6YW48_9PEZI|nr:uncharacterized protein BDZ99DRAFT_518068 [Mytilinidion resinicola]KAF2812214.1 hypothetical protein BDZ99DRAFT_518068 [Mytilinidion resinicola]